jgi:hypothetical protein
VTLANPTDITDIEEKTTFMSEKRFFLDVWYHWMGSINTPID